MNCGPPCRRTLKVVLAGALLLPQSASAQATGRPGDTQIGRVPATANPPRTKGRVRPETARTTKLAIVAQAAGFVIAQAPTPSVPRPPTAMIPLGRDIYIDARLLTGVQPSAEEFSNANS